jgi:phage terminase Nu1 subunit (DNA packaging protein)
LSTVVQLRPVEGPGLLTKKQLAAAVGRSERWIELKQRDGLPIASTDRFGRRRYRLADVERWLHSAPASPRSAGERLDALERQVAELRAMIEEGRRQ